MIHIKFNLLGLAARLLPVACLLTLSPASHAQDRATRTAAASGGSTTALLGYMLERGEIDGALVLGSEVVDEAM